jgi:hypothetical protein
MMINSDEFRRRHDHEIVYDLEEENDNRDDDDVDERSRLIRT